jgi:Ca-activated chloride channel homolog
LGRAFLLRYSPGQRYHPLMRGFLALLLAFLPSLARPCELALVLAVDVSGSVDAGEYRLQMDGLAAALRDGIVADALVDQEASVTLIQWSGTSRQEQTVPWTRIASHQDVAALAERISSDPRLWRNYSTAVGEALALAIKVLDQGPVCARRVIDVSGDGVSNEGASPRDRHPALAERGITVNGLAIETEEEDLTGYFFENLIIGEGAFVITATNFEDYPEQIRRKLQRETTKRLSALR